MRDSFVFYRSFIQAIEDLPPDTFKKIILAATSYALDDIEPVLGDGIQKMAFSFMKPVLDSNNAKWEATRVKRAESGRMGGLAKVANARLAKKTVANVANLANLAVDVNVDVNESVDVNVDVVDDGEEPTTTIFFNIQEAAKLQGFFLTNKQAQGFHCIDPTWLSGDFNFVEFAAEKIRVGPEKTHGDHERIFAKAWSYQNLRDEFPQWRKAKEAEAVAREERHRQETAAEEERRRIEEARQNPPKICLLCGEPVTGDGWRRSCPRCDYDYVFNEVSGVWDFQKQFSLAEEYRKLNNHERQMLKSCPMGG